MSKKALLAAAFCAATIAGGPSAAFAGEVKGPPTVDLPGKGTPPATANQGQPTGGPEHANSICTFSGLNDGNPPFAAVAPTQSYGQDVVLGLDVPNPGEACQGFSNPDNPREHP
jgi:hypothetical protein